MATGPNDFDLPRLIEVTKVAVCAPLLAWDDVVVSDNAVELTGLCSNPLWAPDLGKRGARS